MNKLIAVLIGSCLLFTEAHSQVTRYVVKLKDKGNSPYSFSAPLSYLSQRAIDRRTRYNIAIDSTDLPVTSSYVTQVDNVTNVNVLNVSKWLNSISIQILNNDPNAVTIISSLPFVQSVTGVAARINSDKFKDDFSPLNTAGTSARTNANYYNYGGSALTEIHLHNGEFLHNIGLRGQNMQIAMLDAGFTNYATLTAFDSVNMNGLMLGTWDFVSRHADVNDHSHGLQCYSTIAANIPGQFVGTAPKAGFYLFRTEDAPTEYKIELHNWACGAERADSSGADVISTSLGYSIQFSDGSSIPYADMNGNTTMAAIAADLAAKKGMLVFASIGNDGNEPIDKMLSSPADGDSVIAVGAVNTSGIVAGFSSYGPSSDGQIKPDVAAVGVGSVILNTNNLIGTGNGTSYACPKMAGMATCLWQGFPEFNNMKIRNALWQSGNIAASPNDRIGYGIPDLKKAFGTLLTEFATSSSTINGCRIFVNWTSKDIGAMKYEIERKGPTESNYSKVGELTPTAGLLLANHSYEFINTIPTGSSGTFSYRIKQIIDTAAATLASVHIDTTNATVASPCVVTAVVNPGTNGNYVTVRPNPSSGNTATLIVETNDAVSAMPILIYNMSGRLVYRMQETKGSGKKVIDLPVGKLAKGKYFINVYDKNILIGTAEFIRL